MEGHKGKFKGGERGKGKRGTDRHLMKLHLDCQSKANPLLFPSFPLLSFSSLPLSFSKFLYIFPPVSLHFSFLFLFLSSLLSFIFGFYFFYPCFLLFFILLCFTILPFLLFSFSYSYFPYPSFHPLFLLS